ncbi:hypothetical protein ASA1KI_21010 [Opitutales bacterium ASA1]|uniref:hypothetical protein n=1 Tax=Congregicoccus parvus TaxID=3081749 RepID=UPI002B2F9DCC|nr:hypothetical protein ASA1KI_21010 [Opitutales bacterium ASA1]
MATKPKTKTAPAALSDKSPFGGKHAAQARKATLRLLEQHAGRPCTLIAAAARSIETGHEVLRRCKLITFSARRRGVSGDLFAWTFGHAEQARVFLRAAEAALEVEATAERMQRGG